jgi:hypothetical protein
MAIRSPENQLAHDRMILELVNNLIGKGYQEIRAAILPEFTDLRPEKIYSDEAEMFFTPDVTALHNGRLMVFEVETVDSVLTPSTQAELRTLASFASENQGTFYLVMSEDDRDLATATLEEIDNRDMRSSFTISL